MIALITAVGTVAAPMIATLVGRKDQTAELISALKPQQVSPLELVKLMREMQAGSVPAAAPPDVIDKAIMLAEKFRAAGAGNGGTVWDLIREAVRSVGPGIGQAISTMAEQAAIAKGLAAQQAAQAAQRPLQVVPPMLSAHQGEVPSSTTVAPARSSAAKPSKRCWPCSSPNRTSP